jgi:hypothetical protein
LAELLFPTVVLSASKHPEDASLCQCHVRNSIKILIVLFSIAAGKRGSEKMFSRELPEAVWQGHILGILRLALIPACRNSRGAQEDRVGDISAKLRHYSSVAFGVTNL